MSEDRPGKLAVTLLTADLTTEEAATRDTKSAIFTPDHCSHDTQHLHKLTICLIVTN